jgi:hypothetical protein
MGLGRAGFSFIRSSGEAGALDGMLAARNRLPLNERESIGFE